MTPTKAAPDEEGEEKVSDTNDLYPSSQSALCGWCGAIANYHGKPEDINKAAQEFYRIHNEAHKERRAKQERAAEAVSNE